MSRPKIVIKSKVDQTPSDLKDSKQQLLESTESKISEPENQLPKDDIKQATSNTNVQSKNWLWILLGSILILLIAFSCYYFFFRASDNSISENDTDKDISLEKSDLNNSSNERRYEDVYPDFERDILGDKKSFSELLNDIGIAGADINQIQKNAKGNNLNSLRKGDRFSIFYSEDNIPSMLIIEPKNNPYNKFEINLGNLKVSKIAKKREIRIQEMAAIVETNLGITFINNNLNLKLISKLEEIFEYSVDLFQVDDGDRFKILYEQEFLDGKPYSIRGIRAAYIQEGKKNYYAFMKKEGNKIVYYNEFGESMKRSFLSSPIKYGGVVTSGFGLRVHPKLGYRKMHLGTDYAAPEGTPIVAVADGVVTGRALAGDNGNFIKLKHDNSFETQYLHMQKFEPSVRQNSRVKQGEVIGYVGMTGLATGPHVCFRFKKDGQQVDPGNFNSGTSGRISGSDLSEYTNYIAPMKKAIKKIEYF